MAFLSVIENPAQLEPVSADPFVADLDPGSYELVTRVAQLHARRAAFPHRRIYD
jgi:hypothetical protein